MYSHRSALSCTPPYLLFHSCLPAVRWPTRALQQEEEEEAVASAEQNLLPPDIKVSTGGSAVKHSARLQLPGLISVLATSLVAHALFQHGVTH